jgi:hypothetical protein
MSLLTSESLSWPALKYLISAAWMAARPLYPSGAVIEGGDAHNQGNYGSIKVSEQADCRLEFISTSFESQMMGLPKCIN